MSKNADDRRRADAVEAVARLRYTLVALRPLSDSAAVKLFDCLMGDRELDSDSSLYDAAEEMYDRIQGVDAMMLLAKNTATEVLQDFYKLLWKLGELRSTHAEQEGKQGDSGVQPEPPVLSRADVDAAAVRPEEVRVMASLLKHASDPTRLVILRLLSEKERNVTDLCSAVGLQPPSVSHHLGLLRLGRLASFRRDGRHAYYSLTDAGHALVKAASLATAV